MDDVIFYIMVETFLRNVSILGFLILIIISIFRQILLERFQLLLKNQKKIKNLYFSILNSENINNNYKNLINDKTKIDAHCHLINKDILAILICLEII